MPEPLEFGQPPRPVLQLPRPVPAGDGAGRDERPRRVRPAERLLADRRNQRPAGHRPRERVCGPGPLLVRDRWTHVVRCSGPCSPRCIIESQLGRRSLSTGQWPATSTVRTSNPVASSDVAARAPVDRCVAVGRWSADACFCACGARPRNGRCAWSRPSPSASGVASGRVLCGKAIPSRASDCDGPCDAKGSAGGAVHCAFSR